AIQEERAAVDTVAVLFTPHGSTTPERKSVALRFEGRPLTAEHPNADVDVLAIDVSAFVTEVNAVHPRTLAWAPEEDLLATRQTLEELEVGAGDDILL